MSKHCVRSFALNVSNSIEPKLFVSIPGVVTKIKLLNAGIHKSIGQQLYKIDLNGLFPDGINIFTHSTDGNTFLNYYDLEFDCNNRIDGEYKITATRLDTGALLDTGTIFIYLRFTYE